jgi:GT2 family glycosyltransferase/glycosyltransferase involved in cell wall biosynthesis
MQRKFDPHRWYVTTVKQHRDSNPIQMARWVDIVIPVHGAAAEFERCLASVLEHTNWNNSRLIVVDDAGPDFPSAASLADRAEKRGAPLLLLRNPINRGYVASVNRAMAQSDSADVVLLNSDTVVTPGWLDKLQTAAYSSTDIATVTPFSNNATICSIPRAHDANFIPTGYDAMSFGALVARVSIREYPRIPTGVGFCLYVRRDALRRVGMFDEQRFGMGYGEEVDFCLRAGKAGLAHVLDDATFVFHAGQSSFGKSRTARVRRSERTMHRLHPEYPEVVLNFIRNDTIRSARARVVDALSARSRAARQHAPRRILHLVHGWPPYDFGGTEVYAHAMAVRQAVDREVVVYARIGDSSREEGEVTELFDQGVRVRLVVNNFTARNPLVRYSIRNPRIEGDFDRLLEQVKPDLLHVQHLIGHSVALMDRAAARGIPMLYHIHDFWSVCTRIQLLDHKRRVCDGPGLAKCAVCFPLTTARPGRLWNPILHAWRVASMRRSLGLARAFLFGSRFTADTYRRLGVLPENAKVHVIPPGVSYPGSLRKRGERAPEYPIRFGYFGSIMPHKGVHVAVEAFRHIPPARATLDVFGDATIDPAYTIQLNTPALPPGVRMHDEFDQAGRDEAFGSIDVLLVTSIWPETFCQVAREAMCREVPVITSRIGALSEIADRDGVLGFEAGNASQLCELVEGLIAHPEQIAELRSRLPRVKSIDEHPAEIDRLYEELVADKVVLAPPRV